MYFSTRHWARLLGGYSGFIPVRRRGSSRGCARSRQPRASTRLRRRGATHLTYNCALEERRNRCAAVFEFLDGSPAVELVASGRWERETVRLYRLK